MTTTDCLFCRIVSGDILATRVAETDGALAFRDIAPKAPTHVLVIPKHHVQNVAELADHDPALLAEVVALARQVADDECGGQYRLIFNSGERAGQTVFHAHAHVLGGADLEWSPA